MSNLKKWALLAALTASFSCTAAPAEKTDVPQVINRMVAVVNNDVITSNELDERTRAAALNLRRQNIQLPPMQHLRMQVLEQLIVERAMSQRAQETGIRVDDGLVNVTIEQIAQQNKISVAELRRRLSLDGVSFGQFREEIRNQIIAQRLREREVVEKINIPESEIDAFLADQAGFNVNDRVEYEVAQIVLPISQDMTTGELSAVKDLAEDVLDKAEDGEDFGQLAASYSRASDALEGGMIGWRTLSQLPATTAEAVREALKEKSKVAMSVNSDSYTIVKVLNQRDGVQNKLSGGPVTQTHARHILMAVTPSTDEATILSRLQSIRDRLVNKNEDFATMARLHSVDASATRGGDLGWLHPGDTVPAFEDVMQHLPIGAVSEPVKTQYGWHLIQVLDRRQEAMNADRMRYMARQALRQRKLAEETANWQRELRDRAYVEIRREEL